ncbi:hypothetical protein [Streptomyces prasinopilosus]|uniref:Uncharacterized protein n=1 Tax=Streptomyces prasinopilosus TaxID=67344 RepID=A0A1G6W216_9ACTN|nr:hypothetical protein [Streptomyces prasinopilosus]SDD59990.1 hypothetical protein SAMN05216505_109193 [Streptomyces prasinopilosus]
MGSLRNPVGPLPSSIYWRRRAVLLSLLGVLALLITWVVVSRGGDGGGHDNGADGKNPAPSTIAPGPSSSGPAISQAPGGRDESGDEKPGGSPGGAGAGDDGANGDSGDSGGGSDGDGEAGNGTGGGAGGGSGGGTTAGVGAGDALPAGSGLPDCAATAVKFSLRSVRNSYEPDEKPTFRLTARNISGNDCKVDLGPKNTVLTITQASADDEAYWASDDCPKDAGSLVFRVPADDSITYTVKWDRKPSAPQCATPPAGSAEAGTYLVEAKTPGFTKVRTSFVLKNA